MTELQACLRPNVTLQRCYALSYGLLSAAELQDGMHFWHAEKLQNFFAILGVRIHTCPKYAK